MNIRLASMEDLPALKIVFLDSIRNSCKNEYTQPQINEWTSNVHNEDRWINLVNHQYCIVAEIDTTIVGFTSLENGNYIDFFYVHSEFQGKGIASILLKTLTHEAHRLKQTTITSNVSKTARPFFEHSGFRVIKENENVRNGEILVNYQMGFENLNPLSN